MTLVFLVLALIATATNASQTHETAAANQHLRNLVRDKLECEIASVAIDYYEDKPPKHMMQCTQLDGADCFDLEFPPGFQQQGKKPPHFPTGSIAVLQGIKGPANPGRCRKLTVGKVDRVDPPPGFAVRPNDDRKLQLQHPAKIGVRSAMMMIVRFTDSSGAKVGTLASDAARKSYAQTAAYKLFGTNPDHASSTDATHADVWEECSYGQLTLDRDVDGIQSPGFSADFPGDANDVFYVDAPLQCTAGVGFCTRTYNLATTCGGSEFYGFPEWGFNYLAANVPGFNKNTWQHWVVIFDSSSNACNFVGMGNTNCNGSYCYSWIPHTYADKVQDYTHEMGHNLNLAHSGYDDASTSYTGNTAEYGDISGAMGYCCQTRCYNAPHAYELGWLTPSLELDDSNFPFGTVLQNVPLESMSVSGAGAITLTGSWSGGQKFWLQYKTSHTFDKYMDSSWRNNVQIKEWSGNSNYEKTGDLNVKLVAGQSWTYNDVTVTVESLATSQNPTVAILTIAHGSAPGCAVDADCSDGLYCTGIETCVSGTCVDGPGDPCVAPSTCNESTDTCDSECTVDDDCSDDLYCTGIETCVSGTCVDGPGDPCVAPATCNESTDTCDTPECTVDADCSDGAFCNGVESCVSNTCVDGLGDPCTGGDPAVCNESTDACDPVECTLDSHCQDGLFCNGAETCIGNSCTVSTTGPCGGSQPVCDETNDVCVECLSSGDCADDGLFCNGSESCVSNTCQSSGNPCGGSLPGCNETNDVCVECLAAGDCADDGLFCNGLETCLSNTCQSSGNPCGGSQPFCDETTDVCLECLTDGDCSDDGFFCNGSESCAPDGTCQSNGNPCSSSETCNEITNSCVPCSGFKASCTSDSQCCSGKCPGSGKCTKP